MATAPHGHICTPAGQHVVLWNVQCGYVEAPMPKWTKKELLSRPVEHIDITRIDTRDIIDAYRDMAYSSRTLANAADIYPMMLKDKECAVILTLAGSLISAGLKKAIIT